MRLKHVIGGLLLATVSAFALTGVPGSAQAGPPGPGFCPPGLANKNPACMPPGLYKKFYRGDVIPHDIGFRPIDYRRYDLRPPREGYRYIQIGRDAYLIAEGTRRVIEAINLFDAVGR
jgi:hypothetical protein